MADGWKFDVDLFLEPWTFWRKCASWNSMKLHRQLMKWVHNTSIMICEPVNLPLKKSEWKPSVMKILSTSTSPSEIYGKINLPVEITTPSNLGPSIIYVIYAIYANIVFYLETSHKKLIFLQTVEVVKSRFIHIKWTHSLSQHLFHPQNRKSPTSVHTMSCKQYLCVCL